MEQAFRIFETPDLAAWPEILLDEANKNARRVDVDNLNEGTLASLKIGETLLLNGTIYTGRDAAHKRIVNFLDEGKALPVNLEKSNDLLCRTC